MKKICVVTGTRAEYGLLRPLMHAIQKEKGFQLQLIVTGMHLSPEFGLTVKEVEKEFAIDKRVEILLSSDTPIGMTKSMGVAMLGFADAYSELLPDILLILGDRFEIFAAAAASVGHGIAIAHLHGGETTEGAIDDVLRHAITKMSHLHFTANEVYRKRVIQMGESPDSVFNVGAIGVDIISQMQLLDRVALEATLDFHFGPKNLLVTFHPTTLEYGAAIEQFQALLDALDELEETHIIFTKANADAEGRAINAMIDRYVGKNPGRTIAFTSMGQLRYLSVMQFVDAVVGNSSSGILEAPSFKIGTIDIGNRQKGRIKAESVIECKPTKEAISEALLRLYSPPFQQSLPHIKNPYEGEATIQKIITLLRVVDPSKLLKKSFYDVTTIID
ncbi:UDP-N-acetylglucosamine 2-epimerase [Hydrogenimonas sp.]|uniref:UDP-N-acetylglucosamine 2-epimerase n=1 Tax=Hydrogenimonas sp. TaxID=2231112 RepID=UPI002615871D|nr:UDP-N-acetylglucosamine 2-epimerase [Hydrogenimonas sp.]